MASLERIPGSGNRRAVLHRPGQHVGGEGGVLTYVELLAGFIYLLMGGDLLVRGAVGLARRLRIPPAVVAATVVGFGTSLPELVVTVQATLTGYPNLILGNVVGSNIANVLLVGGVAAAIYPIAHEDAAVRRNSAVMVAVSVAFFAFCLTGSITRSMGYVLLGSFGLLMGATARSTVEEKRKSDPAIPLEWVLGLPNRADTIVLAIVSGLVMLPLGAKLLVDAAATIAVQLNVPETVVGLTVLAVGTSLPELTTTVLAAREGRSDVAVGAIVGSNVFNVLTIMGVAGSLSLEPIPVSMRMVTLDLPVMLASSLVLAYFARSGRPVGRAVGVAGLLAYTLYISTLFAVL